MAWAVYCDLTWMKGYKPVWILGATGFVMLLAFADWVDTREVTSTDARPPRRR